VLRFKQEREAFQEEMEQMLQTARERKAREDALALEVEAYEKKKAEVHQRQQNLLDQRAELERRREEIKNQEMEMRKEEQRLQAISADLGHEAKEHADRSNILRREKEEFQQRSSDMLRRQKARERREEELRKLIKEVEDAVSPKNDPIRRLRKTVAAPARTAHVEETRRKTSSHRRVRRETREATAEALPRTVRQGSVASADREASWSSR